MKLTGMTDIATRIMAVVVSNPDHHWTIERFSQVCSSPKPQITKTVQALSAHGFIKSRRGRIGGFHLACDPAIVTLGELIRAVEPNFALTDCMGCSDKATCPFLPVCRVRSALAYALKAFMRELDSVTLNDVASDREAYAPMLAGGPLALSA
ncbi:MULTISPECIES: RrF2 family transcriptional regulator [Pseudovibrio]|uniref:RrF2 family transcriptional regulator n=1 Tax=Stappiaceae TaxID=2821832 RepID=UPI00236650DB|nr:MULTISPECIES: Rrf2 family transcriptional regulator [Pseudovibrio]MDD7910565.1 Rrf2 family transcriptional regulator [Pseudovibrio exalbescens]MDX5594586.1 Rrf2 family transcriptional regulator [Pseudovibrio sp. SPO723]